MLQALDATDQRPINSLLQDWGWDPDLCTAVEEMLLCLQKCRQQLRLKPGNSLQPYSFHMSTFHGMS
jgi:hypothetical protein